MAAVYGEDGAAEPVTRGELRRDVARLAASLRAAGVQAGDAQGVALGRVRPGLALTRPLMGQWLRRFTEVGKVFQNI